MSDLVAVAVGLLADDAPRNTGPDFGKASPVGLLIIVLLLIGTIALIWSMNRHLKKLPERFDRDNPEPDQAVDDGTITLPTEPTPDNEGTRHEPGA
jgi:F0F1-type ATP synthase assembly protein I